MTNPLIVISNGMAKSASTLLYNYTRLFVGHQIPANGQIALCRAITSGILTGVANKGEAFVAKIGSVELDIISGIASSEGPVVLKTHCDTNEALVSALQEGRIRMTFTHRDPRDMILSGMDHRILTRNSDNPSLQEFTSVRESMRSARWWAQLSCNWVSSGLPLVIRYTDLVSAPARELARVADYLDIPAGDGLLDTLIHNEIAARQFGRDRFNRGDLHRYSNEMSPKDQALCNSELGAFITQLGYQM